MELPIKTGSEQPAEAITVADEVFAQTFNEALVHQVVVAYLAGGRAGTRAQKSRSDVRGGGAKPFRQKGTGRARAGTIRSPLWRGGGVTFAARPQDHAQKVNKKMYRAAMRSIVSELVRQDRLLVVDQLTLSAPRTKAVVGWLKDWGIADNKALLVTDQADETLALSARNLPAVDVCEVSKLNPVNLIRFDKIVMTKAALTRVGEWLA